MILPMSDAVSVRNASKHIPHPKSALWVPASIETLVVVLEVILSRGYAPETTACNVASKVLVYPSLSQHVPKS
jgi:hypothetical protein